MSASEAPLEMRYSSSMSMLPVKSSPSPQIDTTLSARIEAWVQRRRGVSKLMGIILSLGAVAEEYVVADGFL